MTPLPGPLDSPVALFVSPHLDDAAFSVGGTAAALARVGWRVVVATVYTRSMPNPAGFALRCQTDKGVAADADYMAIRRAEDAAGCERLGAEPLHLDLPEAPHRGYESADALFAGVRPGDAAFADVVRGVLAEVLDDLRPALVFAPQSIGAHVDHRHVVRAVAALAEPAVPAIVWYRDLPYALRHPEATPVELLPGAPSVCAVDVSPTIEAKVRACAAYRTQLPFQFARETPGADPDEALRAALALDAVEQGRAFGLAHAEVVRVSAPLPLTGSHSASNMNRLLCR